MKHVVFCCMPLLLFGLTVSAQSQRNPFLLRDEEIRAASFSDREREKSRQLAREMFYFGFDNYMEYAWPSDELDPIHCTGRGPDYEHPENININDVLGDYSLTLIDSLDSLVVMGDTERFQESVNLVINTVSFNKNSTVQVFEATIRVIGGLMSAHLIASDENRLLGDFYMEDYDGQLLLLAHDLATRLMPAFEGTKTGLPYPRVNLLHGVLAGTINETCTSGAGSLLLEFGILSRLLNDESYESMARRINERLWELRSPDTGLLGNVVNIQTGQWKGHLSGLGAGLDSFYEYLLKSYIMFGEQWDIEVFNEAYATILDNMRRGRVSCTGSEGEPPIYVNVDSRDGSTVNTWIDSLQASFAGVQVLAGDVDEAVCLHALYYAVWKKYGSLPERYNWNLKAPDVKFYPLRPELAESTYLLYLSTKNPLYLHVGKEMLETINLRMRVECGFATVHDVTDGSLEDRMESFFLSETIKYLYLLFDEKNPVNVHQERLLFSTQGHIFPIDARFRGQRSTLGTKLPKKNREYIRKRISGPNIQSILASNEIVTAAVGRPSPAVTGYTRSAGNNSCETTSNIRHTPPLNVEHIKQTFELVGITGSLEYWYP